MAPLIDEYLPVRPRKASASRRRRHVNQLRFRMQQHAPGAVSVLLTPVWVDSHGPQERVFVARALAANGKPLPLRPGSSRAMAALLQGAFPTADWNQAQTWRADTNRITSWMERHAA